KSLPPRGKAVAGVACFRGPRRPGQRTGRTGPRKHATLGYVTFPRAASYLATFHRGPSPQFYQPEKSSFQRAATSDCYTRPQTAFNGRARHTSQASCKAVIV